MSTKTETYWVPEKIEGDLSTLNTLRIHKLQSQRKKLMEAVCRYNDCGDLVMFDQRGKVYGTRIGGGCYILGKNLSRWMPKFRGLNKIGVLPDEEIQFLEHYVEEWSDFWDLINNTERRVERLEERGFDVGDLKEQITEQKDEMPPFDQWREQYEQEVKS